MAIEITMPKLSDTMTEGLFARWIKNVGDRIERGEIIAEVETDKAVMELEAFSAGVLIKTVVQGGENVPVGTVLGLIGTAEEMTDSTAAVQPVSPPEPAQQPEPESQPELASQPEAPPEAVGTGISSPEMSHEKASPLVRRLAREQGISLEEVAGSGPEGRITQEDLAAFAKQQQDKAEMPTPDGSPPVVVSTKRGAPSSMRQAIATTVARSWQTIPHFSVAVEINMTAAREIVRELKEAVQPLGYNTLLLKACALALEHFPQLCADDAASNGGINISFAVALPDGVLMPVVRDCNRLTVTEIEHESARLAEKCHAGKLSFEEMSGGCFSLSNLGMYGVDNFTALIMPGQTAILACGSVADRPVVRDGVLVAAATIRATLSSDHRCIDGAYAAQFLAELRTILEKPAALLV